MVLLPALVGHLLLLASSGGAAAPPRSCNRTVSLWVENTTIFAQYPPLAAALQSHAAHLDFLFPGTDLVGRVGPASTDGYVIDARGNLLPMAPKARSLLARFVDEVHGWGLRVAPMVGTQNRPAVQPALWSLLRNRTQQKQFITLAVSEARDLKLDGFQLDFEPDTLPEGGLSGLNATLVMQPLLVSFMTRLAAALRKIGVHHVSAAGYAGDRLLQEPISITKGDLFRGTPLRLYTMGTYDPALADFTAWLRAGIKTAGPGNLGVGVDVCGEDAQKTPTQIDALLDQTSKAGGRHIAMFDAGPLLGTSRDSRLLADGWLSKLAAWVAAGDGARATLKTDDRLSTDDDNMGSKHSRVDPVAPKYLGGVQYESSNEAFKHSLPDARCYSLCRLTAEDLIVDGHAVINSLIWIVNPVNNASDFERGFQLYEEVKNRTGDRLHVFWSMYWSRRYEGDDDPVTHRPRPLVPLRYLNDMNTTMHWFMRRYHSYQASGRFDSFFADHPRGPHGAFYLGDPMYNDAFIWTADRRSDGSKRDIRAYSRHALENNVPNVWGRLVKSWWPQCVTVFTIGGAYGELGSIFGVRDLVGSWRYVDIIATDDYLVDADALIRNLTKEVLPRLASHQTFALYTQTGADHAPRYWSSDYRKLEAYYAWMQRTPQVQGIFAYSIKPFTPARDFDVSAVRAPPHSFANWSACNTVVKCGYSRGLVNARFPDGVFKFRQFFKTRVRELKLVKSDNRDILGSPSIPADSDAQTFLSTPQPITSLNRYSVLLNTVWPTGCAEHFHRPQTGLPDFAHWTIHTNPNISTQGPVVATLVGAGKFPSISGMHAGDWNCTITNCTTYYGGLPQLTNLSAHLEQLEIDITTSFPNVEWSGVASIDWETWKPEWRQNCYNEYWVYINRSIALVQRQHPTWSAAQQVVAARSDFNAAAQKLWTESMKLARKIRPHGRWGWYNFPGEWTVGPGPAQDDDHMMWLFENVNAFFPSIYLESNDATVNVKAVDRQMAEARRVRDKVCKATSIHISDLPIFTYSWMDYYIGVVEPFASTLDATDLETVFVRPALHWGAQGSILWGEPTDTFNATLCGTGPHSKSFYINHSLGPAILKATQLAQSCAEQRCSGNGICWCGGGPDACDCDRGWTGEHCNTSVGQN